MSGIEPKPTFSDVVRNFAEEEKVPQDLWVKERKILTQNPDYDPNQDDALPPNLLTYLQDCVEDLADDVDVHNIESVQKHLIVPIQQVFKGEETETQRLNNRKFLLEGEEYIQTLINAYSHQVQEAQERLRQIKDTQQYHPGLPSPATLQESEYNFEELSGRVLEEFDLESVRLQKIYIETLEVIKQVYNSNIIELGFKKGLA